MISVNGKFEMIDVFDALEQFEIEYNEHFKARRDTAIELRAAFVNEYNFERIKNLTIDEYCRGEESYTRKVKYDLKSLASMGNAYPDTFGVYERKDDRSLALSKTFERLSNGNVEEAFEIIKDEIYKLLSEFPERGFEVVKDIHLNKMFVYKLLLIYYPDDTFPVCSRGTLQQYCECVGIELDKNAEMYVGIQKLLNWKSQVSHFDNWNNSKLMRFCDWLVRSGHKIDGELLMDKNELFDRKKLDEIITSYKNNFPKYWKDEKYKWEAVKHFQNYWNINATDFGAMFEQATSKTINLLANRNNFPREMIKNLCAVDDEAVREMFANLYDESKDLVERIKNFQTSAKSIKDKYGKNEWNKLYQTSNAISTDLWLRYPDKYYIYK